MTPEPGPLVVEDYLPSSLTGKISGPGLVTSSPLKHLPPPDDNSLPVISHMPSVRTTHQMKSQTRKKHLKTQEMVQACNMLKF